MSLETLDQLYGQGASHEDDQGGAVLRELQGFTNSVVVGDSAGDKMDVPALRLGDTLLSAMVIDGTATVLDDVANMSISDTHAFGTVTLSAANPAADGTVTVNDVIYTFKAAGFLTDARHVLIGATFSITGDNLAAAINAYENRRFGGGWNDPQVTAESDGAGVVTIRSVADGPGNGPVVTENTGGTIVVAGSASASVTATFASSVEDDAITVNGVTFTQKDVVVDLDLQFDTKSTDTDQATEVARVINAYHTKFGTLDVNVSSLAAVVTIVPATAKKGNIIPLAESATNTAVSGAALTGGTNTGGVTSTTDLSAKSVILSWYNKR